MVRGFRIVRKHDHETRDADGADPAMVATGSCA
jgi:hypothetical protein